MTASHIPLKVKIIGISVVFILVVSLVGTAVQSINAVLSEDASHDFITRDQFTEDDADERLVINTLKFICPFH
ncbi:MAG: hypothetical protein CL886_08555 [Dehalococcoidia bacterium]|nr:hypothetical protein [Dehalococcoidia bacterium]